MTEKKKDTEPLTPPERDGKAAKIMRVVGKAVIQAFPYVGGLISTIADAVIPPQSTLEREAWEDRATDRINENTDRIDEVVSGKPVTIEGFPWELLVTLLKECPDGLCSERYELKKLLEMFPEKSREDIQDASYNLEHYGLLRVEPDLTFWMVRLDPNAYEQFDNQIMGWNPTEDAVELAKLMIETEEGTAPTLQKQLGWPKRRFNPAQRVIVDIVPKGCVRNVNHPDFEPLGIHYAPESQACLKRFIEKGS